MTHGAELIARPFSKETHRLRSDTGISSEPSASIRRSFGIPTIRRNEAVGPFTVSVAREVLRAIAEPGKPLTWLQAEAMQDGTRRISSAERGLHGRRLLRPEHLAGATR